MSVISNVTRAGNASVHVTQTLMQCIENCPPEQQQHIRQQLSSIAQQLRDVVKQQLPLLSSQQPDAAGAPQPSTDVQEQLSDQLVQLPLHSNTDSSTEAAASGQGNTDTDAVPASHDMKIRPRSGVQRPAPTVADIARSLSGAPGAVGVASYTCSQLLQYLVNTDYPSTVPQGTPKPALVQRVISHTEQLPGDAHLQQLDLI